MDKATRCGGALGLLPLTAAADRRRHRGRRLLETDASEQERPRLLHEPYVALSGSDGSEKWNVLPCPSVLSAQMRPP